MSEWERSECRVTQLDGDGSCRYAHISPDWNVALFERIEIVLLRPYQKFCRSSDGQGWRSFLVYEQWAYLRKPSPSNWLMRHSLLSHSLIMEPVFKSSEINFFLFLRVNKFDLTWLEKILHNERVREKWVPCKSVRWWRIAQICSYVVSLRRNKTFHTRKLKFYSNKRVTLESFCGRIKSQYPL